MPEPTLNAPSPASAGEWFDFLVARQVAAYAGVVPSDFADRQNAHRHERVRQLAAEFADPGSARRLVARAAGRIVGVVSVTDGPLEWEESLGLVPPPARRQLDRLYIHPDFQGAGLGTRMLEAVDDGGELYLWLISSNTDAQRFYRRRGFVALDESHRAGASWGGVAMHRMLRRRG